MKKSLKTIGCLGVGLVLTLLCCAFTVPTTADTVPESPTYYMADGDTMYQDGVTRSVQIIERIQCEESKYLEDEHIISIPSYGNGDQTKTNLCAAVTGSNICGYYDRWATNLLPDYTPGGIIGSAYVYFPQMNRSAIQNCINDLYVAMRINVDAPGTSMVDCKNGLASYALSKGYNTTYNSILQGSKSVNLTQLKQAIDSKKIGLIFCRQYNMVYSIGQNDGYVEYEKFTNDIGHIMAVYGYKTLAYYRDGAVFRTDTFLYVATGYDTMGTAFVKLNDYIDMEDALVVDIG